MISTIVNNSSALRAASFLKPSFWSFSFFLPQLPHDNVCHCQGFFCSLLREAKGILDLLVYCIKAVEVDDVFNEKLEKETIGGIVNCSMAFFACARSV